MPKMAKKSDDVFLVSMTGEHRLMSKKSIGWSPVATLTYKYSFSEHIGRRMAERETVIVAAQLSALKNLGLTYHRCTIALRESLCRCGQVPDAFKVGDRVAFRARLDYIWIFPPVP
jgi:hypothetical protein